MPSRLIVLKIFKNLGIGFGVIISLTILCGIVAMVFLLFVPRWTFNDLVFPPKKKEVKNP